MGQEIELQKQIKGTPNLVGSCQQKRSYS